MCVWRWSLQVDARIYVYSTCRDLFVCTRESIADLPHSYNTIGIQAFFFPPIRFKYFIRPRRREHTPVLTSPSTAAREIYCVFPRAQSPLQYIIIMCTYVYNNITVVVVVVVIAFACTAERCQTLSSTRVYRSPSDPFGLAILIYTSNRVNCYNIIIFIGAEKKCFEQ